MPNTAATVFISVGSNVEPEQNLHSAIKLLAEICDIQAISSVYQSAAFGFENQPDFLNVVLRLNTSDAPEIFKARLDSIETQLGRDRTSQQSPYGPLTLDMDILLWDSMIFDYGIKPWHVPDTSILKYGAVAIPLAEIAPDYVHPEEQVTLSEIAARFDAETLTITSLKIGI